MLIDLNVETIEFIRAELSSPKHDNVESHQALGELIKAQEMGAETQEMIRAMNGMPYSGEVWARVGTPEGMLKWLSGMGDVLRGVAERNEEVKRQRDELVRQRAAVRDFLGTAIQED